MNDIRKETQSLTEKDQNTKKNRLRASAEEREGAFDDLIEKTSNYSKDTHDNDTDAEKARSSARWMALKKESIDEIEKKICEQYPSLKIVAKSIAQVAIEWAEKYQVGQQVLVKDIPKTITDMEDLDKRFALLEAPGQASVIINRSDAQPIKDGDFSRRLNGQAVIVRIDDKGQPKYVDASDYWLGNTHKKVYKNIVFTNKRVDYAAYNLFTGFGVEPKEGKCDLILNHIEEVICAGNKINSNALIKKVAWEVQNIGTPSRIIVVLLSKEQQIGKGTFLENLLLKMYGNSGYQTSDIEQITGRFNDAIKGRAYIYLDEALFSGDRKSANKLKSLSTSQKTGIETKGVPSFLFPIGINFYLATNNEDAAYIEEEDARYWVLKVSPHRKDEAKYFNELNNEINNGGVEAFLHYLCNLDVSDFFPARDVPLNNEAKTEMIQSSINPYDARKWLEECCHSGMLLGKKPLKLLEQHQWEPWKEGDEYENGILYEAYKEWQKSIKSPISPRPTQPNIFGKHLTSAGFGHRSSNGIHRTLPNVENCLKRLKDLIGAGRGK